MYMSGLNLYQPIFIFVSFFYWIYLQLCVCVCISIYALSPSIRGGNRVGDVLLRKSTLNIFIYQNAHMLLDRLSSPPSKMNKRKNTKKIQKNKIG
jgi:hypothetical protein